MNPINVTGYQHGRALEIADVSEDGVVTFANPPAPGMVIIQSNQRPGGHRKMKIHDATNTRFFDNGDGTITDTLLSLMWSKATLSDKCIKHADAEKICAELDLAGHTDWRLPTVDEMFALADRTRHSPAIDETFFPNTKDDWYWTSTITAWSSGYAWIVGFGYGDVYIYHRDSLSAFVRAVRSVPAALSPAKENGRE